MHALAIISINPYVRLLETKHGVCGTIQFL